MAFVLACLLTTSTLHAAGDLVKDGKSLAEIILTKDASYLESRGALDVRHYIHEMSGATLPVVSKASGEYPIRIYVGPTFATQFSDDLAKLEGNDGYAIRQKGSDVYIFGSRPHATFYGLMQFLQRNTDLIFSRPNISFGTVFGKHSTITLTQTDILDIPVFPFRGSNGGHPPHPDTEYWRLRNGENIPNRGLVDIQWDTIGYSATDLSSPLWDKFDEHPEYFAFDKLQQARARPGNYSGGLCLTYPGIGKLWAEGIIRQVRERELKFGRKIEVFRISPGDNWDTCQCEVCIAPLKLPDGRTIVPKSPSAQGDPYFRSTQITLVLNEGMKILAKELPDTKFLVLAYIHMAEPPAIPLDSRYMVFYAPYPTNSMHYPLLDPRQPEPWGRRFKGWLEMSPNLGFYEYYYPKPDPVGYYFGANLRALAAPGRDTSKVWLVGEFHNDTSNGSNFNPPRMWDVGAMNEWVIVRLMWDPHQDIDELYIYYMTRTYREAAPQMIEHFKMLRDSWLDPSNTTGQSAHAGSLGIYKGLIIDRGLESKSFKLLNEALANVKTPSSRTHIERLIRGYKELGSDLNRLMVGHQREMSNDGDKFLSLQWEQPTMLDGFFQCVDDNRKEVPPSQKTGFKAASDDKYFYLRFYAEDDMIAKAVAQPKSNKEIWPSGDHAEFWFRSGRTLTVFAFDCNGNAYDARNLDRSWDSGWQVKTQKTDTGWETIAIIPLEALGLQPGQETGLTWLARREINHGQAEPEMVTFNGAHLHRYWYPIVMD